MPVNLLFETDTIQIFICIFEMYFIHDKPISLDEKID